MDDPSKVLLFGSFSEDETRSWLNRAPAPSNAHKPTGKKELLVSSPKHVTELTFGSFSCIPDTKAAAIPNEPGDVHPSIMRKGVSSNENSATEPVPIGSENGIDLNNISSSRNNLDVTDEIKFRALLVLDDDTVEDSDPTSELLNHKGTKLNGISSDSTVGSHHKEACSKGDMSVLDTQGILPRGLINSGNLCFLNATLQALLSCTPFVQLLKGLRRRHIPKVGYPTLTAFAEFINEFDAVGGANEKKKDVSVIETGRPFCPTMFESVLRKFTPDVSSSISGRPRQEDAQEFLSFAMDQLHDELLTLQGKSKLGGRNSSLVSTSEDDEWETVGPKNKSAVTRTLSFVPTEFSSIFGGQLRSGVKARGNTESATVQPFFLLHLDISHLSIQTIKDALHLFSAPEMLEEYRASTGKAGVVAARKSINIQALPKILILHLMRFGYGSQGSTKLHKAVRFPLEMVLSPDLLVSSAVKGRKYELVSTVTHHGREVSKGHYTADVRYPNDQWLRFDDASVTAISTSKVLNEKAYVLFYKQL